MARRQARTKAFPAILHSKKHAPRTRLSCNPQIVCFKPKASFSPAPLQIQFHLAQISVGEFLSYHALENVGAYKLVVKRLHSSLDEACQESRSVLREMGGNALKSNAGSLFSNLDFSEVPAGRGEKLTEHFWSMVGRKLGGQILPVP